VLGVVQVLSASVRNDRPEQEALWRPWPSKVYPSIMPETEVYLRGLKEASTVAFSDRKHLGTFPGRDGLAY
jgi:hypothetical protein